MAETGYQAWLRFDQRSNEQNAALYGAVLQQVVVAGAYSDGPLQTAVKELIGGIGFLTGKRPVVRSEPKSGPYLILGTFGSSPLIDDQVAQNDPVRSGDESYRIKAVGLTDDGTGSESESQGYILLAGSTEKGILYGVFHLLRLLQTGRGITGVDISEKPRFALRMINQWDNMDGSVERGYSGNSIFYSNYKVLSGSKRIRDYARLLASVGINGIAINNVNVHKTETLLITEKYLPDVAKLAAVFREYGIKLFLSVNYAGPLELGDLETADPLDSGVRAWWRAKADELYRYIPDFGGFLVKADSENRPGPFTYGRDHADGANMLAEAVKPYGGLVLWRCFVYNCHQDWRDRSTDRARAAYDHFKPLDGRFMDNVILQIKNGSMDFQVREPVSPLFGAMEQTNQMMEFQIAQEYTGQQIDACYLVPQWKQVLDFDTYRKGAGSTVKDIAAGEVHPYTHSGITAVSNIGDDENWTGHHLAQANLFGYGRLIWNPELTADEIAEEWSHITFGPDDGVNEVVTGLLMKSWLIYEKYTAPLGVGWMVRPHYHYGVDVDGYEYSKWGTYHFADWHGIGVDRTLAAGTGYTGQYVKENRERYDSLESCPDELLLFFHHVPYRHILKSGKSVIQHIYDTHFEGVEDLEYWINRWVQLEGTVDEDRYRHIMGRLERQLENAKQWRDVINTYFYRKSGIADEKGRTIY